MICRIIFDKNGRSVSKDMHVFDGRAFAPGIGEQIWISDDNFPDNTYVIENVQYIFMHGEYSSINLFVGPVN